LLPLDGALLPLTEPNTYNQAPPNDQVT
jgi:hypothetical protein